MNPQPSSNVSADYRVLVTGASGFIGKSLHHELQNSGFLVCAVDKYGATENSVKKLDLIDMESISSVIYEFRPNVVVHLGTNSAQAYEENFIDSYHEDYTALLNLLSSLKEMPETQIIFMSSNYIYSGLDSKEVVEEEIENISTHDFGLSKRFFEELLLRNHPNSVVLRLSNVYGGSNQKNKTVLLEWKNAVLSDSEIVLWGKGTRKMQYIYIDDVVKIIIFGFDIDSGVYNIGSNEYLSMSEAANILARKYRTNISYLEDKKERMSLPLMKTQKIREQIKNFNFTKFEQGIYEYIGIKEKS